MKHTISYYLKRFNDIDKVPKKWMELIVFCLKDLISHNIIIELKRKRILESREYSTLRGVFSDSTKKLCMATKIDKSDWFETFIHEYSHFCQFKDHVEFDSNLDCETDCEKRSVDIMKRFGISGKLIEKLMIDKNLHLFSISYIQKNGIHPSWREREITGKIATHFYEDYNVIPKDILAIFDANVKRLNERKITTEFRYYNGSEFIYSKSFSIYSDKKYDTLIRFFSSANRAAKPSGIEGIPAVQRRIAIDSTGKHVYEGDICILNKKQLYDKYDKFIVDIDDVDGFNITLYSKDAKVVGNVWQSSKEEIKKLLN